MLYATASLDGRLTSLSQLGLGRDPQRPHMSNPAEERMLCV